MNGSDLNKAKKRLLIEFKKALRGNLLAIILTGSASQNLYKVGWSDLDFIVVVENLNFDVKYKIALIIEKLQKDSGIHHGFNVINKDEFLNPLIPEFSLDGKTLQTFILLKKHIERIVYLKKTIALNKIYYPNADVLKNYCLSNIGMFLLRNRQTLTRMKESSIFKLKKLLKKEIRASLTITKLAVQYFTTIPQENYSEILLQARILFPDFNFSVLEKNFKIIDKWQEINDRKKLFNTFRQVDDFIENFTHYFFIKSNK
jgi:predicted nucleotidyltransferase